MDGSITSSLVTLRKGKHAHVKMGIACLLGLAAHLARLSPRLPLFCLPLSSLWRVHCGWDAGVGVGDGVGLWGKLQSRSSWVCVEFNLINAALLTSSRNSRLYVHFSRGRRGEDVQIHCDTRQKTKHAPLCQDREEEQLHVHALSFQSNRC